jgi:hypothetical protein
VNREVPRFRIAAKLHVWLEVAAFPTFGSVDNAAGPDGFKSGEASIEISEGRTVLGAP